MISLGKQKAKIVRAYISANDNGNPFAGIVFQPIGEEGTCTSKISLTANALYFAAKKLAACGFDIKIHALEEIEANPEIMVGREVEIDVTDETYNGHSFQKVEVVVPRPTISKAGLSVLSKSMREAALKGEAKDAPPPAAKKAAPLRGPGAAVAHIPPEEQARLNKQAEEEGVGF